ncbi:MAG: GTP-binding protein [Candidatus Heimdallarchaeota archaeon]|nr:GTP-binding protein [Candidatus Heimdallarchaeota archaeon]MDH5646135.1 GTP-binding protein [Candidatus Heimdallarchaeota archaeon]
MDKLQSQYIRNLSIISHVDHGKTTLSDYLLAISGLIPKNMAGDLRALDYLPEEQKRGITIESALANLLIYHNSIPYFINLIDTPGHIDFSGKVAESIKLVDGAIIIVDAAEGIMAQTKTVLRQAILDDLSLILFINKFDRLVNELKLSVQSIELRIKNIIKEVNHLISKYRSGKLKFLNFENGNVIIGSALEGWCINSEFVKSGKRITDIINFYHSNQNETIGESYSISEILIRSIIEFIPTPQEGQKNRLNTIYDNKDEEIKRLIMECDPTNDVLLLVGKGFRIDKQIIYGNYVRILSGVLKINDKLYSSISKKYFKITRIYNIHGRTNKPVKELLPGMIGGIVGNTAIIPGEILSKSENIDLFTRAFQYVQKPVVGVSLEPQSLKDLNRLQEVVIEITQFNPGLEYELNRETGEILVYGVGILQLDVLVKEIEELGIELYVSEPIILKYECPTQSCEFTYDETFKMELTIGKKEEFKDQSAIHYNDSYGNLFIIKEKLNSEYITGMIEVFKQTVKNSPLSGLKIRNLILSINKVEIDEKQQTYENGLINGLIIIKKGLVQSKSKIHEPYANIEVNIEGTYLGSVLQVIEGYHGKIEKMRNNNEDHIIDIVMPFENAIKLSDPLRQISDGHVFWSIDNINFLPKK